ncbi:DUF308 domain-containing protein [Candidatus Woesearchaeota archaeon]|nr:DUF308 domain-containing protein [Candidatus Woesearchaeota archaeon]
MENKNLNGIFLIIFGIILLFSPLFLATFLGVVVGMVLILSGITNFFTGVGWFKSLISLLAGILVLAYPLILIGSLPFFIGLFLLIDGIFAIIICFSKAAKKQNRCGYLSVGLIGFILGLIILFNLNVALSIIMILVGIQFIAVGIVNLFAKD